MCKQWRFGKIAHAGLAPEHGRNAILAAAESIVAMQAFERPANGLTRLNVGVIEGGEARNTIPAYVRMKMETRGSTTEYNEYMKEQALAYIAQAADKYGVSYTTDLKGECVRGGA